MGWIIYGLQILVRKAVCWAGAHTFVMTKVETHYDIQHHRAHIIWTQVCRHCPEVYSGDTPVPQETFRCTL